MSIRPPAVRPEDKTGPHGPQEDAMRFMVFVKATAASEAGEMPSETLLTEMGKYNQALVEAGVMVDGAGLKPSAQGARVRFSGTSRTVIDGPFAETKELVAGYWIFQAASKEEAIEWVKKCPNPMPVDSEIEIRPFYELEDFANVPEDAKKPFDMLREKQ
jgi:hypothetical protein